MVTKRRNRHNFSSITLYASVPSRKKGYNRLKYVRALELGTTTSYAAWSVRGEPQTPLRALHETRLGNSVCSDDDYLHQHAGENPGFRINVQG